MSELTGQDMGIEDQIPEPDVPLTEVCPECCKELETISKFCPFCGCRLKKPVDNVESHKDKPRIIQFIVFYLFCVVFFGLFSLTEVFENNFTSQVIVDCTFALVVIIFSILNFSEIKKLWSFRQFRILPLIIMILCILTGGLTVDAVAGFLNDRLFGYEYSYIGIYEDLPFPLFHSILFVAVFPAVFEEISFRGFLYNHMLGLSRPGTAIIVTSLLFGIIHFSILALFWLVPLGLAFAWMRNRYNCLWYGMIGHFVYNSVFVLLEYFRISLH